jgi:hypothetical protein
LESNKFAGGGIFDIATNLGNIFVDGLNPYSNWFPFRTEKQILCGTVKSFGISNYGGESDWNINLLPNAGFESFIADALLLKKANWYKKYHLLVHSKTYLMMQPMVIPSGHKQIFY